MPCLHCFSPDAINKWLTEEDANCPVCRYVLESEEKKISNDDNSEEENNEEDANQYDNSEDDNNEEQYLQQVILDSFKI